MRTREKRIAFTGECMVELLPVSPAAGDATFRQSFSGDTLNAAVYLSRLGGLQTSYVSAVGTDALSSSMIRFWEKEGIDASLTRRIPGAAPGLYMIQVDACGERSFLYWRSASAARSCYCGKEADALLESLGGFDCVYLSGISLAVFLEEGRQRLLNRLEELAEQGITLCFDANFRPRLWGENEEQALRAAAPWYRRMLSLCSMLFLSPEESAPFGLAAADASPEERIRALAPHLRNGAEIIMKDGPRPCLIWEGGRLLRVSPTRATRVVDSTAAGDSFAAAYVHARLHGLSPRQAARRGHTLAAAVIGSPGAILPQNHMPSLEDDHA